MLTRHRLIAAVVLGLALAAQADAQNPKPDPQQPAPKADVQNPNPAPEAAAPKYRVIINYQGADPKGEFAFKFVNTKMKAREPAGNYVRPSGLLRWTVPEDQFAANGLAGQDAAFATFCAEPLVGVVAGRTYQFELQSPDDPAAYGLKNDEAGLKEAKLRADYIRELYGRHYKDARFVSNPDAPLAFQAALWEIIYEGELPANLEPAKAPFSLSTGTFQANYPDLAAAPAYVQMAQTYLQELTGDPEGRIFAANLEGRQLVRLRGLPGVFGNVTETPQSQFALQNTSTGAAGASGVGGAPVGGGGGLGNGGFGGGGGGFGGGGAAPFGAIGGGGFGNGAGGTSPASTIIPPVGGTTTPTPTPPPTTTTTIPPVNQPPSRNPGTELPPPTEQPNPPTEPPTEPTNPVPAPAGLILGLLAVGALTGREVYRRRAAARA